MRQVHGHDVRDHDQRHLRVPDEVTANDVDVDVDLVELVPSNCIRKGLISGMHARRRA